MEPLHYVAGICDKGAPDFSWPGAPPQRPEVGGRGAASACDAPSAINWFTQLLPWVPLAYLKRASPGERPQQAKPSQHSEETDPTSHQATPQGIVPAAIESGAYATQRKKKKSRTKKSLPHQPQLTHTANLPRKKLTAAHSSFLHLSTVVKVARSLRCPSSGLRFVMPAQ